jgi:transketolase
MTVSPQNMANAIRALSMDSVQKANSGHPGMPMGMADVATVLFTKFLKFNPKDPSWADRDRFILSAGHGSMLIYSLLHLTGYEEMTIEQLQNFRQLHSKTCGHPEFGEAGGIETTTGPLGQGIANSVGFALAERNMNARFGNDIVDHHTYVIAGDGCLMEGISHEAISLAGHLGLGKLIVFWDDNDISIDGAISLSCSDDQVKRFEASNWQVISVDGHNFEEIERAIILAKKESNKPTLIACKTTIAKGAPTKAGKNSSHGSPLGDEEIAGTRKAIGWAYEPFIIPDDISEEWLRAGGRSNASYEDWNNRLNDSAEKQEFERVMSGALAKDFDEKIALAKHAFAKLEKVASRQASGIALEYLTEAVPELIGGSADLTGSNLTKNDLKPIDKSNYGGRYIYYGIREHGMAAAMSGMYLHGGIKPYGGTFFVFTDYCRPSIRLAALMQIPVIYVMTHDSIGLGEDGPTHQPVEHLAALRCMPNVNVFRPADATETLECWELALKETKKPSILVLTRQGLTPFRTEYVKQNKCELGAYAVNNVPNPDVVILSTGSEVEISIKAADELKKSDIKARVISIPSIEKFEEQGEEYIENLIGKASIPKIAVEAGVKQGWEKYIGRTGGFIGMNSFGASAPASELFKLFGITTDNIVKTAKNLLEK